MQSSSSFYLNHTQVSCSFSYHTWHGGILCRT